MFNPLRLDNLAEFPLSGFLPIVAFAIGCLLFFQILQERGQMITIRFNEGDGITAGKTAIRYQGLQNWCGQKKSIL